MATPFVYRPSSDKCQLLPVQNNYSVLHHNHHPTVLNKVPYCSFDSFDSVMVTLCLHGHNRFILVRTIQLTTKDNK